MPKLSERVIGIGRKIGINGDNGTRLAVFLVLIIASATAIGYFAYAAATGSGPAPYNTIYLLDNNKKAVDYNETLIVNQNTTFTVGLYVENHMGGSENQTYQMLVKITPNLSSLPVVAEPVQTYDISLKNGDVMANPISRHRKRGWNILCGLRVIPLRYKIRICVYKRLLCPKHASSKLKKLFSKNKHD